MKKSKLGQAESLTDNNGGGGSGAELPDSKLHAFRRCTASVSSITVSSHQARASQKFHDGGQSQIKVQ